MSDKQNLSSQREAEQKLELYKSLAEWPERGEYSVEDKLKALTAYSLHGNMKKTARDTGIPETTIRYWKENGPWWHAWIEQVRSENMDQFDAAMTDIIDKSCEGMKDRLENGDTQLLRDGTVARKPISFRDLALVTGIAFDKRQTARRQPSSYKASTGEVLTTLADKLASLEQNLVKPALDVEIVKND